MKIGEVCLLTNDVPRLASFYRQLLGVKESNSDETHQFVLAEETALTQAFAVSLRGRVRVNSISPGWIDTSFKVYSGPDADQQPAGRVGNPMDIANTVMFLCSDKAGFITGENICVDGGMTKLMIYHGDDGWTFGGLDGRE